MSTQPNNVSEEKELDLSQISKSIGRRVENLSNSFFRGILFLKRNIVVLAILFVIGAVLGLYLDKKTKVYDHEIIVSPNFSSNDYLYAKIDLMNSKINEGDTVFLKEVVGIQNPKKLKKVAIKPITDVYKFIDNKKDYFELMKLMAEDGDINKIIEDDVTSKNYPFHLISFTTDKMTTEAMTVQPIMNYLNKSDYYDKIRQEYEKNIKIKMIENDSLIAQINAFLNGVSSTLSGPQKNNILISNGETQLNDVIKTKDALATEQGEHRLELLSTDKIIKETSSTINIRNNKSTNGKLKILLPFLFIFLFIIAGFLKAFYKRQMAKLNK